MFALILSLACNPTSVPDGEEEEEEQIEATLQCEYTGCDQLCIEVGTEWSCTDTAAPFEVCYDEGYQLCEEQSGGSCGWTMLDQEGWDTCTDGAR